MVQTIIIDEEFKCLLPALSRATFELLEENILENGCRDPLVLWGDILIDGHNRYEICMKHDIPFTTVNRDFESREEVLIWIISVQVSRRNLTPLQLSHYRGLHYMADRILKGSNYTNAPESGYGGEATLKSSTGRLAQFYNVSRATIERDAKVAGAIELIGEFSTEAKMLVLNGEVNVDKKTLITLSSMPVELIKEVAVRIEGGSFDKKMIELFALENAADADVCDGEDASGAASGAPVANSGSGSNGGTGSNSGTSCDAGGSSYTNGERGADAKGGPDAESSGQGDSGSVNAADLQTPHSVISDITGDFAAQLSKLAKESDAAALKTALRSYIDMLEEMYGWI